MKLNRLYIHDFYCYDHAYIDFSEFSSALIVGKKENNDDISNGVGKTTIFKGIEYVLFNHADVNLENIIRDEAEKCSITIDFEVLNQEYRLTRTRTCKNVTDITLYKRTAETGPEHEVLHTIHDDKYLPVSHEKYWQDISGRRASDTEKELNKLIKINIKSFRLFVHFLQKDLSSLTAVPPEKRKIILRDALNLAVYGKLEKLAKEKFNALTKEVERINAMMEVLGNPDQDINSLSVKLLTIIDSIATCTITSQQLLHQQTQLTDQISLLTNKHSDLESKFSALLLKNQALQKEHTTISQSVKEYQTKRTNVIAFAKELISAIKLLEEQQTKLSTIDFSIIDQLSETIISNKEKNAQLTLTIQNDQARSIKLKKPIPHDGECEECRQPISIEHRSICQAKLDQELFTRQANVKNCQEAITQLTTQNTEHQRQIAELKLSKQQLENLTNQIIAKKQELAEKKDKHQEYQGLFDRFTKELAIKTQEIEQVAQELQLSSMEEAQLVKKQIDTEKANLSSLLIQIGKINQEITQLTNQQAVYQHDIKQKKGQQVKKTEYFQSLQELQAKLKIYPSVLQAFSSAGIPNLIIQNVLDDLQTEANHLLNQLKPGIQLSFVIEKTTGKGEETDTLDINYLVNGKKRYFEQLSGGMQLATTFSLKLGLSFLLQRMMGIDIRFLLLDEVEASLDRASVNTFSDIIKHFQKDFTILVITHKDWMKDKFSSAILVEQDANLVSTARVVSSW